jgi:hypothetical protein
MHSYDSALAETINGLHQAEMIHRLGPWRNLQAVEMATLQYQLAESAFPA